MPLEAPFPEMEKEGNMAGMTDEIKGRMNGSK